MRARVIQADPIHGDPEENAARLVRAAEEARDDGVDLLVFPELYLTGYYLDGPGARSLVDEARATVPDVEAASEGLTLVVGTARNGADGIENLAAVYDDGHRLGAYQKTHLYDAESSTFVAGSEYPTFDTTVGEIGVQICYDVEFPEVSRRLADNGADVLVTISANMRPFESYQRVYRRARAQENARPHVLCNRVGEERDLDFFGGSSIVDARGTVLAGTESDAALELTADVPDDSGVHETLSYLDDRRIGLQPN